MAKYNNTEAKKLRRLSWQSNCNCNNTCKLFQDDWNILVLYHAHLLQLDRGLRSYKNLHVLC